MDRDEAIKRIREGLEARTGRDWSVTAGKGSAKGWIRIEAPARRRVDPLGRPGGLDTSDADRAILATALDLDHVYVQGVSIPPKDEERRGYVDRAEGRKPWHAA